MNKQWKVGLSIVALVAGFLTQASYAADKTMSSTDNTTMMKSDMVDVNMATSDQLMGLGLDKKQTDAVMKYRADHKDGFKKIEDLRSVIGEKKYNEIKSKVMVGKMMMSDGKTMDNSKMMNSGSSN